MGRCTGTEEEAATPRNWATWSYANVPGYNHLLLAPKGSSAT